MLTSGEAGKRKTGKNLLFAGHELGRTFCSRRVNGASDSLGVDSAEEKTETAGLPSVGGRRLPTNLLAEKVSIGPRHLALEDSSKHPFYSGFTSIEMCKFL